MFNKGNNHIFSMVFLSYSIKDINPIDIYLLVLFKTSIGDRVLQKKRVRSVNIFKNDNFITSIQVFSCPKNVHSDPN
jgi:hypothetical protein